MMLLDETLADDAAQNSLIEILRSARTYRGQSSVERWADRITARTALRHKREERRHAPAYDSQIDAEDLESAPVSSGTLDVLPRPLEDYLVALPDVQREALILKHSFDYTTEEIAEMTGTAVGTIKDRLVTARRHIRKLIQRDLSLNIGTRGRT
jgi:RNA polymerase sigma-70 factor (ECF subfamily)